MIFTIHNLLLIYLFINLILSIISKTLIDDANRYWKEYKDPPKMGFVQMVLIGVDLFIGHNIFYAIGYIKGYIEGFLFGHVTQKINDRAFYTIKNVYIPIIKILVFLPISIYIIVLEIYYKYRYKGDQD